MFLLHSELGLVEFFADQSGFFLRFRIFLGTRQLQENNKVSFFSVVDRWKKGGGVEISSFLFKSYYGTCFLTNNNLSRKGDPFFMKI